MALMAPVVDGKLETSSTTTSTSSTSSTSGTDKESFLQLLVAQMKYQDPLEPTSNTEYISQYAQFTQVEEIQNMSASMDLMRASGLVGQEVVINRTDDDGNTKTIQGKVDYVTYENSKAYLSINGLLYSIDDLANVIDDDYSAASDKAEKFTEKVNDLPSINLVNESNLDTIDELVSQYNAMSEYEQGFISSDVVTALQKYAEKAAEIRLAAETEAAAEAEAAESETETDEATDTTETTDTTDAGDIAEA